MLTRDELVQMLLSASLSVLGNSSITPDAKRRVVKATEAAADWDSEGVRNELVKLWFTGHHSTFPKITCISLDRIYESYCVEREGQVPAWHTLFPEDLREALERLKPALNGSTGYILLELFLQGNVSEANQMAGQLLSEKELSTWMEVINVLE